MTYIIDLGLITEEAGKGFIFFATAYRLAMGPTQPTSQWVPVGLSPGVAGAQRRPLISIWNQD
jgi:hypothetical protein